MTANSHAPGARPRRATPLGLVAALVLGLAAALAAQAPARAQDSGLPSAEAVGEAVRGVIDRQLRAFGESDVETAFGLASPNIQGLFGSPENFGRMVEQGYPMVWRHGERRFLELAPQLTPEGPRLRQSVMLRDASGALWIADYLMMPMDGGWRIDGVSLRKAEATGV